MKEGGGWEMDTAAILRGTKNLEAARRLMDFAASPQGQRALRHASSARSPCRASPATSPTIPAGVAELMIKNDFAWASANRARILAEWTRRYEGKAAKKN